MLSKLLSRVTSMIRIVRRWNTCGTTAFPNWLHSRIGGELKDGLYHGAMYQHDQWGHLNDYNDYYSLVKNEFIGMWGRQNRYEDMNRIIAHKLYLEDGYGPPSKDRNRKFG